MIDNEKILMTGGGGRLGSEIRQLIPNIAAPDLPDFDITNPDDVAREFDRYQPKVVIHAAAYTDVSGAERNKSVCWSVNVDGTRNIVKAAIKHNSFLIHISTDYVFFGDTGMYKEEDPVGPVRNYYSLSKLAAESIAKAADRCLIIRTSFRPKEWPYKTAFSDLYTSQDYVDIIAQEIALAIKNYYRIPYDVIHIATERKSILELARRRKPDVIPGLRKDADVDLPHDISLDITRWLELKKGWANGKT